ncbi:GL23408 [Drosophila persimilis]|uniref:GL23408 n=1 Tax=Drosophila persimilis TaxID=7234 RepID=B4G415_DROPE|nr:GL23408 [Drosophila persimilis]
MEVHVRKWALRGLLLRLILLGHCYPSATASHQVQSLRAPWLRDSIDIKDKIIDLQCSGAIGSTTSTRAERERCLDQCILELLRAPRAGSCPTLGRQTRPRLSCLDNCVYDHDCADVQKCCVSRLRAGVRGSRGGAE